VSFNKGGSANKNGNLAKSHHKVGSENNNN